MRCSACATCRRSSRLSRWSEGGALMLPRTEFDAGRTGPLDGVRVVDLSRLVAGNMATLLLADYGADVIKIEHPDKGGDLRKWRGDGYETFWKVYARNKRSLSLDVRADPG